MIITISDGAYSLIETKDHVKILTLDNKKFAWVATKGIGEILVSSRSSRKVNRFLAIGRYRLYDVKDEPKLTDQQHLELNTGRRHWQSYLLPTGLPGNVKKRARIIATPEVISAPKG